MKTRIFIVDDHPLVRDWLAALIKQQPDLEYLGQAGDATKALSAMLETPPDVAIVDLTLPGSSGLDLIRNLTEQLPGTQAIVLTMHDELFYVERALRAGARGYVMKHESTNSILDAIRAVQTGLIYANPRLLANIAQRIFGRNQPASETAGKIGAAIDTLSDRELEVFQHLGRGRTTRQIAETLHLSIKTVQSYCVRIKEKLNLTTSAELIYEAVSHHARTTPEKN
jgi:DNA-binding NarL/FixJ family response regulator